MLFLTHGVEVLLLGVKVEFLTLAISYSTAYTTHSRLAALYYLRKCHLIGVS